ncbi:MAG: class I SAM-dependent methyltransferase [Gammaproteobacteria bacterium]|jgi:SAM-dependent methyltransferase|nr:class I SAM-dependent methyltransferase [Gammaproteobacteria bacterium]MBK9468764.1 class I SAM-dependent methyltransferase [Gammaproteobacteria bacterium]MBP6481186.1 class I SAM-dependent methyltransferase [Pseudomonadales bacterium]MBP7909898.1 class I SAM-dependent methyltransferase [Pseudomonadales bacterium]
MPLLPDSFLPDEPLRESAPVAYRLAHQHCPTGADGCRDYHAMWQYFRQIGLLTTIGTNTDFLVATLRGLADADSCRRVLISATADYGMLAHVLHAYRLAGVEPEVTVVDMCETPLALNRWYAERAGVTIRTCRANLLEFRADAPFDLVCTHSFLGRLTQEVRAGALDKWHEVLRPGGHVVTVARVRYGAPDGGVTRYEPAEIVEFRDRALALARAKEHELDLPAEAIADAAEHYAVSKRSRGFGSTGMLRALFEDHGFALERFDSGGEEERRRDRPSCPTLGWKSERFRIVAVRR